MGGIYGYVGVLFTINIDTGFAVIILQVANTELRNGSLQQSLMNPFLQPRNYSLLKTSQSSKF